MADTQIQRSFSSGEVSPSLYSRVDQAKYQTGLRTMRNCITMRAGGAQNRPGTTFVAEVKNSSNPCRLIPFIASTSDAFILELGDQYMRFHHNGQQVSDGVTPRTLTAVTNANPAQVTSAAHGLSNGDEINIQGCIGMIELNDRNYIVRNVTTNTFTLTALDGTNIDSTHFGVFIASAQAALPTYPNAVKVLEIATPWGFADIFALKYVQSNDVMSIVHPNYAPRKLTYSGGLSFTISAYTFAPTIPAPTSLVCSQTGSVAAGASYVVTAVAGNGEESGTSNSCVSPNGPPTSVNPVTLDWSAPTLPSGQSVAYYNIYRAYGAPGISYTGGSYCQIGIAQGTSYIDDGHAATLSAFTPLSQNPFGSATNYPSTVAYFQGRLLFGSTLNNLETVWASVSGDYTNFSSHVIAEDDDSIQFTLNSRQISPIQHLVDINRLLVLTSAGEYMVAGDANGVFTPSGVNPIQQSYYGASSLQPLLVGNSALFVQARGAIVRDIEFEFYVNGYRGSDLTVFSSHLFDGYTLSDWAYQQIPGYNVWAVRADGILLGMTYIKEQQMVAWHRHDTQGTFESVACIPEGFEDAVYLVVNRTVGTTAKRYIERMSTRIVQNDNVSFNYTDCARTNVGSSASGYATPSLTLSGGTHWDYTETLTLTAAVTAPLLGLFDPTMVGDGFQITGVDGSTVQFVISAYTSPTVVSGSVTTQVPASLQNTATLVYARTKKKISGLWHLNGRNVSILADGAVVASPNNSDYSIYTVANGTITLPKPSAVVTIGLAYLSDLETLDIDTVQGQSIDNKKMVVNEVTLRVDKSRGIWVSDRPPTDDSVNPLQGMTELKLRDGEDYGEPNALVSRKVKTNMQSNWNGNGRVFIRQTEPLPMTILSISPSGNFPMGGV